MWDSRTSSYWAEIVSRCSGVIALNNSAQIEQGVATFFIKVELLVHFLSSRFSYCFAAVASNMLSGKSDSFRKAARVSARPFADR